MSVTSSNLQTNTVNFVFTDGNDVYSVLKDTKQQMLFPKIILRPCHYNTARKLSLRMKPPPTLLAILPPTLPSQAYIISECIVNRCTSSIWANTLQASLSGTFLHTPCIAFRHLPPNLPDLVTPLKGHSLSPRSCPPTRSAPSERFRNR